MAKGAKKSASGAEAAAEPGRAFGIGEWFGFNIEHLTAEKRREFAASAYVNYSQPCPYKGPGKWCSKGGGVCGLRMFAPAPVAEGDPEGAEVDAPKKKTVITRRGVRVDGVKGQLRITCPSRFHENNEAFNWVGEVLLGDPNPVCKGEVGFLESAATTDGDGGSDVGKIDMILVSDKGDGTPAQWCAVEIQAVYFSGDKMDYEFDAYANDKVSDVIVSVGRRHMDYRSSGPKRLMPQLQIKVPTLRRWGKKMAVVVDRAFFDSLGEMDHVPHASNADVVWFIVRLESEDEHGNPLERSRFVRDEVRYTTLERAVEGLTGGTPVSLPEFEKRIVAKGS